MENITKQIKNKIYGHTNGRDYIGASAIGHPCSRKIWLDLNSPIETKIYFDHYSKIFDGHIQEQNMLKFLQLAGILFMPTVEQYNYNDIIKGTPDGIIISGLSKNGLSKKYKKKFIWENKVSSNFNQFKKKPDLKSWNEIYYAQAIVYMGITGIHDHFLTVCNHGCTDFDSCFTNFDKSYFDHLIEKTRQIKAETEDVFNKLSKNKIHYLCKMCNHVEKC